MKKTLKVLGIASIISFTACSDDDDSATPAPVVNTPQKIEVSTQTTSRNSINISSVNLDNAGWIVIHRDNGNGGPVVPDIISEPKAVAAGSSSNIEVKFDTVPLTDGETVWVMLHTDDGDGVYEFDTDQTVDLPVSVDGNILMKSIQINSPKIVASNQTIMNNQLVIDRVEAAKDGYIVVHHYSNESNAIGGVLALEPIAGKIRVNAGVNTNVVVDLTTDSTYTAGYKLYPMLHIDGDGNSTYDFPGGTGMDLPEVFSNNPFPLNVIFTAVTAQ